MKVCAALMADPKSAKSVNPSKGSFDNPTPAAMPLTRLAAIPRDACGNALLTQPRTVCPRCIGTVGTECTWTLASSTWQSFNGGDCLNDWYEQSEIVNLGTRSLSYQQQAMSIDQDMVLT
jgi:hypothetical protein